MLSSFITKTADSNNDKNDYDCNYYTEYYPDIRVIWVTCVICRWLLIIIVTIGFNIATRTVWTESVVIAATLIAILINTIYIIAHASKTKSKSK